MKQSLIQFVNGLLIGIANVIPGVSGGTIALITGILERLLNMIKNVLSIQSVKLIIKGKFKEWARFVDFQFAFFVFLGVIIAIISIARLFKYLFEHYPVYIWAFFFGLVLASVYFVLLQIKKVTWYNVLLFIVGSAIAVAIALLHPASENKDIFYLFICGVVAAASMILPGISGSFVLVLMGNYELIMIQSINDFNLQILAPVVIGAGIGMLALSHVLSWLFKHYPDQIISLLSGFMLGSLLVIWPWKSAIYKTNALGEFVLSRSGEKIVERYQWFIPPDFNTELVLGVSFILLGLLIVWLLEHSALKKTTN